MKSISENENRPITNLSERQRVRRQEAAATAIVNILRDMLVSLPQEKISRPMGSA